MISLKKHIDGFEGRAGGPDPGKPDGKLPGPVAEQWVARTLQRFEANEREMKDIVEAMTKALRSVAERDERYAREVVDIGQRLRSIADLQDLARIRQIILANAASLTACVERMAEDGRESLRRLNIQVANYRARLGNQPAEQWVERASMRFEANRRELKEIVNVIRRAVESVTGRDERHSSEVGTIAQRLRSIANLRDLARIHHGVIDNASALTVCVERIAEDGLASLRQLTAEAEECRSRLNNPERLSSPDLLTDATNRREFAEHLRARIQTGGRFCLILISLHELKQVNSRFGRMAGDDLLQQFALEVHAQFPTADQIGRCGGDEFAAMVTTSYREALASVNRLRHAALGEYKVNTGEQFVVVRIDATIGLVEWDGAETGEELLTRAAMITCPKSRPAPASPDIHPVHQKT